MSLPPGIVADRSLVKWLKDNISPQQQYGAISCIWQLSFEQNAAEGLDKKYDIVALFTEIAKSAVKEKVIRVIVATFRVSMRVQ